MSGLLYNIGIFLYGFLIRIAALFNRKARSFVLGRKNIITRLKKDFKNEAAPVIWFHCASLGEFEQARPLIETFKKTYPSYKILLTFFSPSGYEVRKDYEQADWIYYLPLDSRRNARLFLSVVNPKVAFFIKYEYWHNILKEAHKKNIPVISASSIFRQDQPFFKNYDRFFKAILKNFDHFFVQDKKSKALLEKIGITNVTYAGDTRFDRVKDIREHTKSIPLAEAFANNSNVFVIGSCWPKDMAVLTPFINNQHHLKFILAPHNLDEKFINKLEHELLRNVVRFSNAKVSTIHKGEVLIIDNIGMLASLYKYGKYAYVGGAFGQGLHNILEPATFGLPVFFGNSNYQKFKEAVDLVNVGGAFAVESYSDLQNKFTSLSTEETYQMTAQITADYIKNNTGSTEIIIDYCKKNFKL